MINNGSTVAAGPWGGRNGFKWDDGVYSGVRQVVISSSSHGIHFIQFEYDKNGHTVWSDKHGGNSGTRTDQIKLDYPAQFLVSISGYCGSVTLGGPVIVRSLLLETSRKTFGPFGIEQGAPFSLPVNGQMIVGFHGWRSNYLDSIGVYVKPLGMQTKSLETHKMIPRNSMKVLSLGPWGGEGGMVFDDGIYAGVREVHITRSGGLVSIRVCYDQNGRMVWGHKSGGSGGLKLDKIVFDYPYEVLTHITGYYGSTMLRGPTIVKSITFHTNKRSYGPFGDQQGISFSSGSIGAIVGFHGRNGYFVDSIGVHVLESKPVIAQPVIAQPVIAQPVIDQPVIAHPYHHDPYNKPSLKSSEVAWGVPLQRQLSTLDESGPWGGEDGKPWDDGIHTGVKKIILTRGDAICSIQVQYDQNGHSVWSAPHGIPYDTCTYHINFDYPYEVLTSISGSYYYLAGDMQKRVVKSLTFHTNKAKYGPYGKAVGTIFSSANKEGKIAGFHGRSGTFLDAIGIHMQHWVRDEVVPQHPYPPERGVFRNLLHKIYR